MSRGWKIGLAAALLAVAALAVLAGFRLALLETLARRELAALGLAEAELEIEAAGLSQARVVDLLLAPGVRAEEVRLRYDLLPPRLVRVEIDGLFLDLSRLDPDLLARLRQGGGDGDGTMPEIVLDDAHIEAETPLGPAAATLSGRYGPEGGRAAGIFRVEGPEAHGRFSVSATGPFDDGGFHVEAEVTDAAAWGRRLDRATATAAVSVADGAVALDGELALEAPSPLGPAVARLPFTAQIEPARFAFRVEGGEASAPESGLSAQGVSATLTGPERIELGLAAQSVVTGVVTPFALDAHAQEAAEGFEFELTAQAQGATLRGRGRHDPGSGSGQARLTLQPVRFAPGGLQPAALVPALAAIEEASGAVAGDATLRWREATLEGGGEARLDDLSFAIAGLRIEGLNGDVRFVNLLPPTTAPKQVLRARKLDAGVALRDLSLTFRLDGSAPALEIARLEAGFAGGSLVVANARIEPAQRNALVLQVYDVDLASLLALIGLDGLSGSGRMSGALPLVLTEDGVLVEDGEIAAMGPGVLSFRSEEAKQALAAGGDYVDLALQALENFRYEKLSLTLDKAADGRAVARLSTLGSNPQVLDGHPFAINVTLRADADALLAQALEAWRLSQGALATIVRGR